MWSVATFLVRFDVVIYDALNLVTNLQSRIINKESLFNFFLSQCRTDRQSVGRLVRFSSKTSCDFQTIRRREYGNVLKLKDREINTKYQTPQVYSNMPLPNPERDFLDTHTPLHILCILTSLSLQLQYHLHTAPPLTHRVQRRRGVVDSLVMPLLGFEGER